MKSPRQSNHQQSGSISSLQQVNQSGEQQQPLLQYNVSNYIQVLMQQKNANSNQQQFNSGQSNQQNINSSSSPMLIQLDKQNFQNSVPNLQLIGMSSQQSLQQQQQHISNQQQQQLGNSSSLKNLESNDINYLLKAYQEREKQIKIFRNLRKEYRFFDNFKTKEFQTFYLNGYDSYVQCMREEKQRVMQEECTIKKYFNIKADQLSLKIVVFNLINSILQTNQASYNELIDQTHDYEANELLKQTNKFKEEIHKYIYKNQFRLTSIIIYICNFSRSRFLVEQERFDIVMKRHEDVYKDAIKQRQAIQQSALKQQQQQRMQQLSSNLSQAISNYKQVNGLNDNQNINQIYSKVMSGNNGGRQMRLQSAQPHSNYNQQMMSSNNYLYQDFSSDGDLEALDDNDFVEEENSNIINIDNFGGQEEIDEFQKNNSPNKLLRSFSNGLSDTSGNNGPINTIKVFKSPSKNLRIKQQISSAKKPSELRSNRGSGVAANVIQIVNSQDNIQNSSSKAQNAQSPLIVPAPKNLFGLQQMQMQQQQQQSSQLQTQKLKINSQNALSGCQSATSRTNYYNNPNQIFINNNTSSNNQLQLNQQLSGNNTSNNNFGNGVGGSSNFGNISSNINLNYPSLGPAVTLSIKLSIMKNEKSRQQLKKLINDYNVSNIPSRVKCKRYNKTKKSMQQNQIAQYDVEETFYHLTMQADLLYATTEVTDTKIAVDRLFQLMQKQNNQIKNTLQQYCNQTKNYQSKITKNFKSKVIDYHKSQYKQPSHKQNHLSSQAQSTSSVIYFSQIYSNYLIIEPNSTINTLQNQITPSPYFSKDTLLMQTSLKPSNIMNNVKSKWINQQFITFGPKEMKYLHPPSPSQPQATVSEHTSKQNIDSNNKLLLHSNSTECLSVKGIFQTPLQRNLIIRSSNLGGGQSSLLSKENSSPTSLNRRYNQDDNYSQHTSIPHNSQGGKFKDNVQSSISNLNLRNTEQSYQISSTQSTHRQHIPSTNISNQNQQSSTQDTMTSMISSKYYAETLPISNKISQLLSSPPPLPPSQKPKKMKSMKENSKTASIYQISEKSLIPSKSKPSSKGSKKSNSNSSNQLSSQLRTSYSQVMGGLPSQQQSDILSKRNSGKFPMNTLLQVNNTMQPIQLYKQSSQKRQSLSNKQSQDNSFENQPSPNSNLVSTSGQSSQNNFKIKHINLNMQQNSIQDLIKKNVVSLRLSKHCKSQKTSENQDYSQLKTEKSVTINEGDILNTITSYKSQNMLFKNDLSYENNPYDDNETNKISLIPTPKPSKKSKTRPSSNIERKSTKLKGKSKNKSKYQANGIQDSVSQQQEKQPQQQDSTFFKENLIKNLKSNY